MPVDFELVNVDSSLTAEDDINNAIMSIRRNGVALKGVRQGSENKMDATDIHYYSTFIFTFMSYSRHFYPK